MHSWSCIPISIPKSLCILHYSIQKRGCVGNGVVYVCPCLPTICVCVCIDPRSLSEEFIMPTNAVDVYKHHHPTWMDTIEPIAKTSDIKEIERTFNPYVYVCIAAASLYREVWVYVERFPGVKVGVVVYNAKHVERRHCLAVWRTRPPSIGRQSSISRKILW